MRESRVSPARRTEGVAIATLLASPAFADDPLLEHWAFRPLDDAPPSIAREADQAARDRDEHVCDPLDAHVAAALARRDLAPAPPADRATLVRRVHLTLTGLPPTPDVMASALADANPDWYERLVDELLASPRYGERWARHWLDVVRYAESHGFETNRPRRNAWHYRDWVIDAFNRDTPYDRFIAEQLAGDELGADAATGFLVAGPNDIVKSPDIGLTLMQRADELADVVDAASTTFLALTVACARCHDHKFDPISQRDYYALSAIFAGVQHGERPLRRALGADERDRLAALDERLARVLGELGETPVREAVDHERNVERFEPVVVRAIRFTVLATDGAEPCIDEFEVWSAGEDARNVALASSGATASASGTLPGYDIHRLEHLNDGRYGNARSWISNTRGSGWVEIEFARPVMIDRVVWGRDREGQYRDRLATSYRVEVGVEVAGENAVDDDSGDREWRTVAVSDDRRPRGAPAERFPVVREMLTTAESARASVLLDELLEVERSRDAIAGSDGPKVWACRCRSAACPYWSTARRSAACTVCPCRDWPCRSRVPSCFVTISRRGG